jgi:hypothetical protein
MCQMMAFFHVESTLRCSYQRPSSLLKVMVSKDTVKPATKASTRQSVRVNVAIDVHIFVAKAIVGLRALDFRALYRLAGHSGMTGGHSANAAANRCQVPRMRWQSHLPSRNGRQCHRGLP